MTPSKAEKIEIEDEQTPEETPAEGSPDQPEQFKDTSRRGLPVPLDIATQLQRSQSVQPRIGIRRSFAWYWRGPSHYDSPSTTCGLIGDQFYFKDGWKEQMVEHEKRKSVTDLTGEKVWNELVLPVDEFGRTVKSVPVVAMRPIGWDRGRDNSQERWDHIKKVMERNAPLELERERTMLTNWEADVNHVTQQSERTAVRERIRVLQRRIATFELGFQWDLVEAFFLKEAERSMRQTSTALTMIAQQLGSRPEMTIGTEKVVTVPVSDMELSKVYDN